MYGRRVFALVTEEDARRGGGEEEANGMDDVGWSK